jgi:HPt (histidine-containing phosphotransfer) domain-containing protein
VPAERPLDPQLDVAFARFWEADRPAQQTRIAVLRSTAKQHAFDEAAPDEAALDEAARIAHGLGGVAAMYGFRQATVLALEVERCFDRRTIGPQLVLLIDQLDAALTRPYRPRSP